MSLRSGAARERAPPKKYAPLNLPSNSKNLTRLENGLAEVLVKNDEGWKVLGAPRGLHEDAMTGFLLYRSFIISETRHVTSALLSFPCR